MSTTDLLQELERRERDFVTARGRERQRRAVEREREQERLSLERVNRWLREAITRAHDSARLLLERQEADKKLRLLQTLNPKFVSVPAGRVVKYATLSATVPAAYIIDCLLFAPNARHLAQRTFPGQTTMIMVVSFVIPLVLLALETTVANHLASVRKNREGNSLGTAVAWATAIVATAVMPALVAVTQLAIQPPGPSSRLGLMFSFQTLAMVVTALLAHGLIVFGGRQARQAKAFVFYYKPCEFRIRRRNNRLNNSYVSNRRAMADAFINYRRELDVHNAHYRNSQVEPGPFDRTTAQQLNNWFGYIVVDLQGLNADGAGTPENIGGQADAPSGGQPEPPPPPRSADVEPDASPAQTQNPEDNGVEEYYRSLLSQRVGEEESEVRVTSR
jgi:hypothetical protein